MERKIRNEILKSLNNDEKKLLLKIVEIVPEKGCSMVFGVDRFPEVHNIFDNSISLLKKGLVTFETDVDEDGNLYILFIINKEKLFD